MKNILLVMGLEYITSIIVTTIISSRKNSKSLLYKVDSIANIYQ